MLPSRERLEQLFDKPYGSPAPTEDQWREFYAEGVHFIDPTQEKQGLKAYLCLLYTSPSPRDKRQSRMPSSA